MYISYKDEIEKVWSAMGLGIVGEPSTSLLLALWWIGLMLLFGTLFGMAKLRGLDARAGAKLALIGSAGFLVPLGPINLVIAPVLLAFALLRIHGDRGRGSRSSGA